MQGTDRTGTATPRAVPAAPIAPERFGRGNISTGSDLPCYSSSCQGRNDGDDDTDLVRIGRELEDELRGKGACKDGFPQANSG